MSTSLQQQPNSNKNNVEALLFRLFSKIASNYNLSDKVKEKFIDQCNGHFLTSLCSGSFSQIDNFLDVSQKIKRNLIARNRTEDVNVFSELETKLSKSKIFRNHAAILNFFYVYSVQQSKYGAVLNRSHFQQQENRINEVPRMSDNVSGNILDKSSAKKFIDIFKSGGGGDVEVSREIQRLKPNTVVNEGYILRELIYALQGVDGRLFGKDQKDPNSLIIKTELDRSVKMLVLRFLECGWLYLRLRKFLNLNANLSSSTLNNGLIQQAFCAYLSAELKEYHRLLAVLESQLGSKDEGNDCGNLTLRRLLMWLDQPMDRLKFLNIVCEAVKDKKGGVFLSTLYSYSNHGDAFKSSLLKNALLKCALPIRDMIVEWICDGVIRDNHEEFFISMDKSVPNERLWHDKYRLRQLQIPNFISEQQAKKILVIGKSINYLRVVCNEQKQVRALKSPPSIESMLNQKSDTSFQDMIDEAYLDISSYLMEIMKTKYHLLEHFNSIKRYMLLGQGDFIRHLMDLMEDELNKPAHELMSHNLKRLLDKAISETNAQYDPPFVLSRLDVRFLTIAPNDKGWDVFTLEYNTDGPIKTIFTYESNILYLRIFNFLWRVKRMEYTNCATWRLQKSDMEKFRTMTEVYQITHQSNIISSEMLRLLQNLNFYIMFEVLEVSWKTLSEELSEAKDLDDIIAANEKFVNTVISQLLLDNASVDIAKQMRSIFDQIERISALNEVFYKLSLQEFEARNRYKKESMEANTDEKMNELEKLERKRYHQEMKPKIKTFKNNMEILKNAFKDMLDKLLKMLYEHPNDSLRFLAFRFNFNEYYN